LPICSAAGHIAGRLASLLPGLGIAAAASAVPLPAPAKDSHVPKKLNAEGKPADKGFITPLIVSQWL
jgi:hypothetical protein